MPYNTRRKSLSLPSLGIHVPLTQAERAAAQAAARSSASALKMMPPPPLAGTHPNKRPKRTHVRYSSTPPPAQNPAGSRPGSGQRRNGQTTPPPSPSASEQATDEIPKIEPTNDEVIDAAMAQLRSTGNRPYLAKEFTVIFLQTLPCIQQSANPCAMISSRLANYIKRPCWTASAPCPLGKEFETVHPRRTFYFLTTCPRQPHQYTPPVELPDHASVTPSLSPPRSTSPSVAEEEEEVEEMERRRELSPSPEIDLSTPGFDDLDDAASSSGTPLVYQNPTFSFASGSHYGTGVTPLEKDEREFTQTADGLQKRKLGELPADTVSKSLEVDEWAKEDTVFWVNVRTPAQQDTAAVSHRVSRQASSHLAKPSPTGSTKKENEFINWARLDKLMEWDQSPESMDLEELDLLFAST